MERDNFPIASFSQCVNRKTRWVGGIGDIDVLPSRTAVFPNTPISTIMLAFLLPELVDFVDRQAFIVTVIPLLD